MVGALSTAGFKPDVARVGAAHPSRVAGMRYGEDGFKQIREGMCVCERPF
jgi:hypothetical protein